MPQTPELKRPDFIRRFINQLDQALTRDVRVLRKLDEKSMVPEDLKNPIKRLIAAALEVTYDFSAKRNQITRRDKENVQVLKRESDFFVQFFEQVGPRLKPRLVRVVRHLLGDIDHFVFNFTATLNSFNPGAKVPWRPIKKTKRSVWASIVKKHLNAFGVFPRHTIVYPQMRAEGFTLSKETHGDWKKRYLAGEF
jgi:hypothetical protein